MACCLPTKRWMHVLRPLAACLGGCSSHLAPWLCCDALAATMAPAALNDSAVFAHRAERSLHRGYVDSYHVGASLQPYAAVLSACFQTATR